MRPVRTTLKKPRMRPALNSPGRTVRRQSAEATSLAHSVLGHQPNPDLIHLIRVHREVHNRQVFHKPQRVVEREFYDSQTGIPYDCSYGARCVQRLDDSQIHANRITFRISLRSSSLQEPRDPLLKVVILVLQL